MSIMRTFLLMLALTMLIVIICVAVWGNAGANIGIGIAVVTNILSYWFADKVVIAMTGARELRPGEYPQLAPIVQRLASAAAVPMPKLYVLDNPEPNAFATGRDPANSAIAVTAGIMNTLTEAELTGVIAHELAHIKHRDILISAIAATMAGIISQFAYLMRFNGIGNNRNSRTNPLTTIAIMLVAPLAATLIRLGISREREFAADEGGAQFSQDPLALAKALAKIEQISTQSPMNINPGAASLFIINPFSSQQIMSLFSTHPPTSERIARLQEIAKQMQP